MPYSVLRKTGALLFVLSIVFLPAVKAQSHFTGCISKTADNSTVIIPTSARVALNGESLATGDEIAVFGSDGKCAGVAVWSATNMAITVWAADDLSKVGGLKPGEPLHFAVWDASRNVEYHQPAVTYVSTKSYLRSDGLYASGAIYEISSLESSQTATDSENEIPATFELLQNYPNPSQVSTRIEYVITTEEDVTLEVYNVLGQRVEVLVSERQRPGKYDVSFETHDLPNGTYIYRLKAGSHVASRKMIVAR